MSYLLIGQMTPDPRDHATIIRSMAEELLWPDAVVLSVSVPPLAWCVGIDLPDELVSELTPERTLAFCTWVARQLGEGVYIVRAIDLGICLPDNIWSVEPGLISFRFSLLRGVPLGIEIEDGVPIIIEYWHWVSAFLVNYLPSAFPPVKPVECFDNLARLVVQAIADLWMTTGPWLFYIDFSDLNSGLQPRPASVHSCHKEIN